MSQREQYASRTVGEPDNVVEDDDMTEEEFLLYFAPEEPSVLNLPQPDICNID